MSAFFEGRRIIEAKDLKGPRIYSTDLLPSHFDSAHVQGSVRIAARALKIKILTKGLVTLNSAYLISPLFIHLLDEHPDVLSGSAILPAFRVDKASLEDLVPSMESMKAAGIDAFRLRDHITQVDELVEQVMPWNLGSIGAQYRNLVLAGLRNPSSTIHGALISKGGCTPAQIETIASGIEALSFDDSLHLRSYFAALPLPAGSLLNNFALACYHMVGTSVVNCEAGTDLSPLSDFKAADVVLAGRDADDESLSDEAVFLKAFMGFALDTIQAAVLPAEIIDALDFKTAHELSAALRALGFQDKYDGIVRQYLTSSALEDTRAALDSIEVDAVAGVARALAEEFQTAILAELPHYKTLMRTDTRKSLYRATVDIVLDGAEMIPVIGNIVSLAEAAGNAFTAAKTAREHVSLRDPNHAFIEAPEHRARKIRKAIATLKLSKNKKSKLLDAVALLSDVHGIRITRA
jgi:hypothetical protein